MLLALYLNHCNALFSFRETFLLRMIKVANQRLIEGVNASSITR